MISKYWIGLCLICLGMNHEEGLKFVELNDYAEFIPVVAQWQYDDWHGYDKSLTLEKLMEGFKDQTTIVAFNDQVPMGSISLQKEGEPEFSDLGDVLWVGTFHVIPNERNKGIGTKLGLVALEMARRLGYREVYFYTSDVSNVAKYVKKGAQVFDSRPFRGHTITLMKIGV